MLSLREFYQFIISEQPEAPEDEVFGQYAFAPERSDVPKPPEPNTPKEQEVFKALQSYFGTNEKKPLSRNAELLYDLVKKGHYNKILDPSEYSMAYRFMRVKAPDLASIIGVMPDKLPPFGQGGSGVLSPLGSNISGWTVDPDALTNDMPNFGKGNYLVVFVASISENSFFGAPGALAQAAGVPEVAEEMETIAFGPVKYQKYAFKKFDLGVLLSRDGTKKASKEILSIVR